MGVVADSLTNLFENGEVRNTRRIKVITDRISRPYEIQTAPRPMNYEIIDFASLGIMSMFVYNDEDLNCTEICINLI
jgi:hypothetical protein